jgi:hypothetical protein
VPQRTRRVKSKSAGPAIWAAGRAPARGPRHRGKDDPLWGIIAAAPNLIPTLGAPALLAGDYAVLRMAPDEPNHETLRGYAFDEAKRVS